MDKQATMQQPAMQYVSTPYQSAQILPAIAQNSCVNVGTFQPCTSASCPPPAALSSPHHHHHHRLAYHQQQIQMFWSNQIQEIEQTVDFRNHSLPLARIKKIMKADEDVRMISAEAPVVFAKACEMFINELTLRAWILTEENKRRTLHKNDIAAAITRTDVFDFLVDIVPRDDSKDDLLGVGTAAPMMRSTAHAPPAPYYYVSQPQPQHQQQRSLPHAAMIVGNSVEARAVYSQQPRSPVGYQQMWQQQQQAHLAQHSKSPSSGC